MSWPKAFIRFPDKPKPHDFNRATVWGFTSRGHYIEDGKVVHGPVLAAEVYCLDGCPENFDRETQLGYQDMIIPFKHVVFLNWEATEWLHQTHGITRKWLRDQGVKLYADGYGADVKQVDLDKT